MQAKFSSQAKHTAWLTAFTALSATILAAPAQAQSSVTLYGIVDLSVENVKGTASVSRVSSGNLSGSRLGVKGSEDLGSGLRANFMLETGVRADTGASNGATAATATDRFWDRQSWVGLNSASLGELRLGRTDSSLGLFVDRVGTQAYDDLTLAGTRGANAYRRVDNAITYLIPAVVPGLTGQLQYALAGVGYNAAGAIVNTIAGAETSANDSGKVWSANLAYTTGPFAAAVAYLRATDESRALAGHQNGKAAFGMASWDFTVLKLTGYYNIETGVGPDRLETLGGKLAVPFGPAFTLTGGVSRTKGTTAAANDKDGLWIYSLKGTYALSKRTTAYAWLVNVDNDAKATKGVVATAAGLTSRGIAVGLRHNF